MRVFALLFVVAVAVSQAEIDIKVKQINGLKRLLKNMDGIYASCNIILFSEMVDYETADARCKNFDIGTGTALKGNLATVDNEDKNADLVMLLGMAYDLKDKKHKWDADQWVWAGLRKVRNNVGKPTKVYNAEDWEWADGSSPQSEFEASAWMDKMPDQKTQKKGGVKYYQNQMRINHYGRWDDTYIYKEHPYACDYQGKYILSATQRTWHHAREACQAAGLDLAKVRNMAEVEEMKAAAAHFLGPRDESLKVFDNSNWLWLGGNDLAEEGTWTWTDGSEVVEFDGMAWRAPNPDDAQYIGQVGQDVMAFSKWGQFDDSFDTRRKRPFACQCPGT